MKVLDFGLAKLTEIQRFGNSASISTLLFNSTPGLVMGTVGYMSPEQARGVSVDYRTDVWSFGVLLYEMVSGSAPFQGETPTDIVVAIVEKEQPPISQYNEQVPFELERIVRKALRKNPNERYQSVKEMGIDLRGLRKDLATESLDRSVAPAFTRKITSTTTHQPRTSTAEDPRGTGSFNRFRLTAPLTWIYAVALVALVSVILIASLWFFKWRHGNATPQRFQQINVTKLTTNSNALMAALSPDGKYLAYVLNEAGKQSLWLRQVAITSNVQLVGPREGRYLGVAFSPDGNFVYFGYAANDPNDPGQPYRIPVLGCGKYSYPIGYSERTILNFP